MTIVGIKGKEKQAVGEICEALEWVTYTLDRCSRLKIDFFSIGSLWRLARDLSQDG